MARVLVLGGSGFVGQHLLRALKQSGWAEPIAGQRRAAPIAGIPSLSVDATDEAALARALSGVTHVINCVAGSPHAIAASARTLFAVANRQPGIARIVHFSSMAVYGGATGLVDEGAPLDDAAGGYVGAKVAAERTALSYGRSAGEVVILRPGCIHGPGSEQWTARIARLLLARRIGDLGASGEGLCNLSYIGDVVAAALAALRQPGIASEAFNIVTPDPDTWNAYFARLADIIGAAPLSRVPRWRLEIEARLIAPPLKIGQIARARRGIARGTELISPGLLLFWSQKIQLDHRKAERALPIAWASGDAAIEAAGKWFLSTLPGARLR